MRRTEEEKTDLVVQKEKVDNLLLSVYWDMSIWKRKMRP